MSFLFALLIEKMLVLSTDSTFFPLKCVCQPSLNTIQNFRHIGNIWPATARQLSRLQDLDQVLFHRKILKIWIWEQNIIFDWRDQPTLCIYQESPCLYNLVSRRISSAAAILLETKESRSSLQEINPCLLLKNGTIEQFLTAAQF